MEIFEELNVKINTVSSTMWQVYIIFCILIINLSLGAVLGFVTMILAQEKMTEQSNDRSFFLWFMIVPTLMELPTMIVVPAVMQKRGRKAASYLVVAPMAISWILLYISSSKLIMLFARVFQGFSLGGIMSVSSVLVSEYSAPEYRGIYLMLGSVLSFSGIWLANLLGTFLHWKTISLILGLITILNFFTIFTWPESPSWLAMKGYDIQCRKVFHKIRGNSKIVENELNHLLESQKQERLRAQLKKSIYSLEGFKQKILSKDFYKPLFSICILYTLHAAHGKVAITIYAVQVYLEMTGSESQAYILLSVYDITTIIGLVLGCYLIQKLPRKLLLIASSIIAVVCMLATSFLMILIKLGFLSERFRIASVVIMFIYMLGTSFGCSSAPVFMGELVPLRHRGSADSLASIYFVVLGVILSFVCPPIVDYFKTLGIFVSSALLTIPCIILVYYYIPETRNKTLQEIEDYYLDEEQQIQDVRETELTKINIKSI